MLSCFVVTLMDMLAYSGMQIELAYCLVYCLYNKALQKVVKTHVTGWNFSLEHFDNKHESINLLSCQPKVTVTPCFVYRVIRDLESIYHLCINPIHSIGLIHK